MAWVRRNNTPKKKLKARRKNEKKAGVINVSSWKELGSKPPSISLCNVVVTIRVMIELSEGRGQECKF